MLNEEVDLSLIHTVEQEHKDGMSHKMDARIKTRSNKLINGGEEEEEGGVALVWLSFCRVFFGLFFSTRQVQGS